MIKIIILIFKKDYILKLFIIFYFFINLIIFYYGFINNCKDDFENTSNIIHQKVEEFDVNVLMLIHKKLGNYAELSFGARKFLNGIIRKYNCLKIVEIGVSAGGSSVLILNAINDKPKARLYSIDRNYYWYRNHTKKTGWLVKEKFPELMKKWKLYAGLNPSECIESIGNIIYYDIKIDN